MQPTQTAANNQRVDSFRHMHRVICRDYSTTSYDRIPEESIDGRLIFGRFGPLGIGEIAYKAACPMHTTRGLAEIRRDPRDEFLLLLVEQGEAQFTQNDRECCIGPGDMVIWNQALPFRLNCGPLLRSRCMTMPSAVLRARSADADHMVARAVRGESRMGALAGAIVRQLAQLGGDDGEQVDDLSSAAMDMLAAALQRALLGVPEQRSRHADLLGRIKKYILANLHDPELDVNRIAQAHNIGPRTVHRLFMGEGSTAIRWLWQQRLSASYRDLAEGRALQITDVAFRYGFNDSSHFSRAFRRAFGKPPHAVRNVSIRGGC